MFVYNFSVVSAQIKALNIENIFFFQKKQV